VIPEYLVYSLKTGKISHKVSVPAADLRRGLSSGEGALPDTAIGNDEDSYVDVSVMPHIQVMKRRADIYYPSKVKADGESVALIQVPDYIGVEVTGPSGIRQPLIDDQLRFSTPEPGAYTFVFEGIEHLTTEVVINAT